MPMRSLGRALSNLPDCFLHGLYAAELLAVLVIIERLHRGREIDAQHDVDAAFLHLRAGVDLLRPGQRDDETEERQIA